MSSVFPTPEPPSVLTTWERVWYFVASNRMKIGALIFAASGLVRGSLLFHDDGRTADVLKFISELVMLGGGMTAASGATQNDQHFKEKKQAVIRGRSGQYRAFDAGKRA